MEYVGEVKGGVIVLDGGSQLTEGTKARVEPIEPEARPTSLGERLLRFAGAAKGLPADMAEQHDRYLTDALTGDHHFEQAGFRALPRPDQRG